MSSEPQHVTAKPKVNLQYDILSLKHLVNSTDHPTSDASGAEKKEVRIPEHGQLF